MARHRDDLPPDTNGRKVTLQVGVWIAQFTLEIPARNLQLAQERASGWVGPRFEGDALAMERARIDKPRDPEMGGWDAVRLVLRLLGLGFEEVDEAALDELSFGLTPEPYSASCVNRPFRHDEQLYSLGPRCRDMDADAPAHAVTNHAAADQSQGVDQSDDRSGVILAPIAEVRWPVAVPMAEEVDQERTTPSQRCPHGGREQLTGRRALPTMQPQQRRIVTRDFDIADEGAIAG